MRTMSYYSMLLSISMECRTGLEATTLMCTEVSETGEINKLYL